MYYITSYNICSITKLGYVTFWDPGYIKFKQELEPCPLDWKTPIHWNVVPRTFQQYHICQDCWKTVETTWNIFLLSNPGDKVQIVVESTGQICPVDLLLELLPCPLDWRSTLHWNVVPTISKPAEICGIVGKLLELHWSASLFSNPGDKVLSLIKMLCSQDIIAWQIYWDALQ